MANSRTIPTFKVNWGEIDDENEDEEKRLTTTPDSSTSPQENSPNNTSAQKTEQKPFVEDQHDRSPDGVLSGKGKQCRGNSIRSGINGDATYYSVEQSDESDPEGVRSLQRCTGIMFVLAIVALSSMLIGFAIPHDSPPIDSSSLLRVNGAPDSGIDMVENGGEGVEEVNIDVASHEIEEVFLQIAENVVQHCSEESLGSSSGRMKCQRLCSDHLCCFDVESDNDVPKEDTDISFKKRKWKKKWKNRRKKQKKNKNYSCQNDESKKCMVYAGCEVLLGDLFGDSDTGSDGVTGSDDKSNSNAQMNRGSVLGDTKGPDGKVNDEPPLPPPLRCMSDADDGDHTPVYSDDWNDERYNRCRRWEQRNGMKITEYWSLYGINP